MALESTVHCLNFEAGFFFMDRMPFLSSNLPTDSSRGRTAGHSLMSYPGQLKIVAETRNISTKTQSFPHLNKNLIFLIHFCCSKFPKAILSFLLLIDSSLLSSSH